jgi:hypothetical protein
LLKGNEFDAEKIHKGGFDLYEIVAPDTQSTKSVLLFAIDWSKGRGFFYETRAYGGE